MRFREPFDDLFGRRSNVALLRHLVLYRREATGRELARSVGLDPKTCHDSLRDLERQKVVDRRRIGTAMLYSLRTEQPVVRAVLEPAFEWERTLLDRYARELRELLGPQALSIFLFGSTAKGTEDANSDIDLLVVSRDRTAEAVDAKSDDAASRLIDVHGRFPQIIVMDARDFTLKFMKGDSFLMEILRTGRLLDGLQVHEILKHGRAKSRRRRGSRG